MQQPTVPPIQLPAAPALVPMQKDPRDWNKQPDIPKFNGIKKDAEDWVLGFSQYCKFIRITEDDHILMTFGIATINKAGKWWQYAEKSLPYPDLRKYGNVLKKDECTDKLRTLYQGSMTIGDYITEIEDLNLYAQLDPHLNFFSTMPTPASTINNSIDVLGRPYATITDRRRKNSPRSIHRNIRTRAASGEADAGSGQTGSYLCFRASWSNILPCQFWLALESPRDQKAGCSGGFQWQSKLAGLCVRNHRGQSIPHAVLTKTKHPGEYGVKIGNKLFSFYLPYIG